MNLNDSLNQMSRSMLDFFFPQHCPFCGRVAGKALLCEQCAQTLPRCTEVRTGPFGECAAPLYYEDAVRDALLAFKFRGKIENLNCFGALMAETAASAFADRFDAVTWTPVSQKRLKKRGFDQSRMLCASLCVDWHTQPLETLRKTQDNPPQSGLEDAAERRANVLGVYEPAAHRRHPHHRRDADRVRPGAEGRRRGGRGVPDAGHGAGKVGMERGPAV